MTELGTLFAILIAYVVGFLTALGLVLLILFFEGRGLNLSLQYGNMHVTLLDFTEQTP